MTTISQYLRAERPDYTEPVSFHAPGAESWQQSVKVGAAIAARSRAPREHVYPVEGDEPDDPVAH